MLANRSEPASFTYCASTVWLLEAGSYTVAYFIHNRPIIETISSLSHLFKSFFLDSLKQLFALFQFLILEILYLFSLHSQSKKGIYLFNFLGEI